MLTRCQRLATSREEQRQRHTPRTVRQLQHPSCGSDMLSTLSPGEADMAWLESSPRPGVKVPKKSWVWDGSFRNWRVFSAIVGSFSTRLKLESWRQNLVAVLLNLNWKVLEMKVLFHLSWKVLNLEVYLNLSWRFGSIVCLNLSSNLKVP